MRESGAIETDHIYEWLVRKEIDELAFLTDKAKNVLKDIRTELDEIYNDLLTDSPVIENLPALNLNVTPADFA